MMLYEHMSAPRLDADACRSLGYTLEFLPARRVAVRLDCNRGSGSWSYQDAA